MNKKNIFVSVIFFFVCVNYFFVCVAQNKEIFLIDKGVSKYTIVIPQQATQQEIYAANLLQKDFKQITSYKLPIVSDKQKAQKNEISIGNTNRRKSSDTKLLKGYKIKTEANKLFIYAGNENEDYNPYVIYGVVDFLQSLGVRKYTTDCQVYPKMQTIKIAPIDTSYCSQNTYRQVYNQFTPNNEDLKYWFKQHLWEDMFAKGFFVHTMGILVPREEYFASHPEYYALVSGKRNTDQLCMTNPDVIDIVVANLKNEMAKQPDKKVWSVSQNDNYSYCQCPECKAMNDKEGSAAGALIYFVNEVAKHFPNKTISTLAYQYSRKAPLHIKPANNVQIMLCTIEEDRNKAISDQLKDSTQHTFANDINDWGKISKNILLWDYEVNFAYSISPFPNIHTLKPNLQFFMQNNAFQHFQQANSDTGHEFAELKMYLLSSLEWNINQNQDSLINGFLRAYYHNAAPQIREYIDKIENYASLSGDFLDIYASPTKYSKSFLSAAKLSIYEKTLQKAQSAVKDDSAAFWRVREAKLPVLYAIMDIGKADMFSSRGWYYEQGGKFHLRKDMLQRLEEFNETCNHIGVKSLNESALSPKQYYESTRRFININVEGNMAFRKTVTASVAPSPLYSDGDLKTLTNGVNGECEYKVHWLGWHATDFTLTLDLDTLVKDKTITLSSLYYPKSWILHPSQLKCLVSSDNKNFKEIGSVFVGDIQKDEQIIRDYKFTPTDKAFRYVRFEITGTKHLPAWHASAGEESWIFLDEITVK